MFELDASKRALPYFNFFCGCLMVALLAFAPAYATGDRYGEGFLKLFVMCGCLTLPGVLATLQIRGFERRYYRYMYFHPVTIALISVVCVLGILTLITSPFLLVSHLTLACVLAWHISTRNSNYRTLKNQCLANESGIYSSPYY